jgi:RNA-directed DNA polymerase
MPTAVSVIKAHDFQHQGLRDWIFACTEYGAADGKLVTLFGASTVPIKRHTKVRSEANPFDPAWKTYFQRRAIAK